MNDKIIGVIGEGGFSKVCLVEHVGELVARKRILITPGSLEKIEKEVNILKELKHRNIIIYKDSLLIESENKFYIYTEYMKYGDLLNIIKRKKELKTDFSFEEIMSYMSDLISVLKYIHGKEIIHRDLKPGNILVGDHNELIICDFGFASENGIVDENLIGTYLYMAPELYTVNPPYYSPASDIFSLGCILYEIYTLKRVYEGNNKAEIKKDILSNKELKFERINGVKIPEIEDLIKRMLENQVYKRIKLNEIEEEINKISSILPPSPFTKIEPYMDKSTEMSNNLISGESSSYFEYQYNSLILNFYLGNGPINGKTLNGLSKMNLREFNSYWNDDLIPVYIYINYINTFKK